MRGVVKECDVNVSKSRSIDSSQIAQVLANSLIFEFPESKESNVFPWQRQANRCQVVCGGKEMEQKSLKLGHLGQGICKCFWREPNIKNFMELEINKTCGKKKDLWDCGNGNPTQVQIVEAWAPLKSTREGQQYVIDTQKNEVFQFQKWPLKCR